MTAHAAHGAARELRLDRMLGRLVVAANNRRVGRLEEFRARVDGDVWTVDEYVIGVAGLFERLGVAVRLLLGRKRGGYVARWDQIDISDPDHPRLLCALDDLQRA